mmetsp:Transcript_13689/g.32413  ORF Transcript_13689/g.32413 Transcript_13689/m.32413 type:complete len:236 (-) Transcript_13689:2276-2983(-)
MEADPTLWCSLLTTDSTAPRLATALSRSKSRFALASTSPCNSALFEAHKLASAPSAFKRISIASFSARAFFALEDSAILRSSRRREDDSALANPSTEARAFFSSSFRARSNSLTWLAAAAWDFSREAFSRLRPSLALTAASLSLLRLSFSALSFSFALVAASRSFSRIPLALASDAVLFSRSAALVESNETVAVAESRAVASASYSASHLAAASEVSKCARLTAPNFSFASRKWS